LGLAQVSWVTARVGVHRLFPFCLPYLGVFFLLASPAIGFQSFFIFTTDVSAPIRSTLHFADGEFPGLGLALILDVVVPEAEHGVRMKQKSDWAYGSFILKPFNE